MFYCYVNVYQLKSDFVNVNRTLFGWDNFCNFPVHVSETEMSRIRFAWKRTDFFQPDCFSNAGFQKCSREHERFDLTLEGKCHVCFVDWIHFLPVVFAQRYTWNWGTHFSGSEGWDVDECVHGIGPNVKAWQVCERTEGHGPDVHCSSQVPWLPARPVFFSCNMKDSVILACSLWDQWSQTNITLLIHQK